MIRTTQADISPGMVDLAIGHPDPELLPLQLMRRAAEHRLGQADPYYLQYGYEQGDGYFRVALAAFLSRHYGSAVSPDELFVTGGVSQALDLLCTLYTRPGDTVFIEEPTYFLALRIFADHRLQTLSLPADEKGLQVEALEERLKKEKPAFLYTVASHQNPSGATLSLDRRLRLAELSAEHGFPVVADEVYHLLTYRGQPPPPLAALASRGRIVSLGSFSKILAPGLRLGWIQAPFELLRPLLECGMLDSGGGLNPFTSALVRSAIELGLLDRHLESIRLEYGRRLEAMGGALERHLEGRARFARPSGGFFYWLRLDQGCSAVELLEKAVKNKTRFVPGSVFSASGLLGEWLRLSFCHYDPAGLEEGVRRLARSLGKEESSG